MGADHLHHHGPFLDMIKFKQCNRYRSEVLTLRQELGLPVASDLLVEDSLPNVLSSAYRTGGTPSRRVRTIAILVE